MTFSLPRYLVIIYDRLLCHSKVGSGLSGVTCHCRGIASYIKGTSLQSLSIRWTYMYLTTVGLRCIFGSSISAILNSASNNARNQLIDSRYQVTVIGLTNRMKPCYIFAMLVWINSFLGLLASVMFAVCKCLTTMVNQSEAPIPFMDSMLSKRYIPYIAQSLLGLCGALFCCAYMISCGWIQVTLTYIMNG